MRNISQLIKNKNFMLLWISAIVSQITINMVSFLIITMIFERTGSSIATSFVWVAYALAAILFGPFGAVTADLVTRRKILMITTLTQAIVILIYSFLFSQYFFLAYGVVFIYSSINQFYVPAEAATLPRIVKSESLPLANGVLFITVQTSLILGLVSAGFLYESIGVRTTLLLTTFLLIVAFSAVSFLPRINTNKKLSKDFERAFKQMFSEIIDGFVYIKSTRNILIGFLLLIGLQVSLSVLVILMPVIASTLLHVKASMASAFVVLPAAIGALIGTSIANKLMARRIRKKNIIISGLFILSISIFVFATFVPMLPFWISRTLSLVAFAFAGFSYVVTLVPTITYLQEQTPGGLLGRVLGNIWFISAVATVIPVIFAGTVAELFGVSTILTIMAVVGVIGTFILANVSRIYRNV